MAVSLDNLLQQRQQLDQSIANLECKLNINIQQVAMNKIKIERAQTLVSRVETAIKNQSEKLAAMKTQRDELSHQIETFEG